MFYAKIQLNEETILTLGIHEDKVNTRCPPLQPRDFCRSAHSIIRVKVRYAKHRHLSEEGEGQEAFRIIYFQEVLT